MKLELRSQLPSSRHFRNFPLIAFLVILGIGFNYYYVFSTLPHSPELKVPYFSWFSKASKFWGSFAPLLEKAAPKCSPPQRLVDRTIAKNREKDESWKEEKLVNSLNMTDEDVESMRRSHSLFLDLVDFNAPTLEYESGTKGIVTCAGGEYFPVLIVSLLMLRRTGSKLPVEVFLTTPGEYEPQVCEVILPALDAKCIILSEMIKSSKHQFYFRQYQLKIFAILFSSFESLLFLDADNLPLHRPEELFDTEPFTSHHLVLWPDYWTPTVSPYFSNITGLDSQLLQSRPTIEAGQILVSKTHHTKTLLLSAYYNAYGDHYYDLITQGGPGQGDKDTFAPAALVTESPFYTVEKAPAQLGHQREGSAMIQYDPVVDSNCGGTCHHRPFFVHASWTPKLNALKNIQSKRVWGTEEESMAMFDGLDLERTVWGYMVEISCGAKLQFEAWGNGNKTSTGVCARTRKSYRDMFQVEYERIESF